MSEMILEEKEIRLICDGIRQLFDVEKLIVFGVKRSESNGNVTDFDLCAVADTDDKNAWIKKVYIEIDSEIPFDLFLYTPTEWDRLTKQTESFASRIARKGCVVYGKA